MCRDRLSGSSRASGVGIQLRITGVDIKLPDATGRIVLAIIFSWLLMHITPFLFLFLFLSAVYRKRTQRLPPLLFLEDCVSLCPFFVEV